MVNKYYYIIIFFYRQLYPAFLFQKLLVFSSDDRISAGKALLHPYFAEFGFHPTSHSPTSDLTSESSHGGSSMSEGGASSDANTSLSPVLTASTSFSSSHETSGESFGDLSAVMDSNNQFIRNNTGCHNIIVYLIII